MRQIQQRTDRSMGQALKCVEFRLPLRFGFEPTAFRFALGLRYGLIGVAAAHHVLLSSPDCDVIEALRNLQGFGAHVKDHLRRVGRNYLPVGSDAGDLESVGNLAAEAIYAYVPLYRKLCPLETCLAIISAEHLRDHRSDLLRGTGWLKRRSAFRAFRAAAAESAAFALCFFERRQVDLDEVREIALLGE